MKLKDKVAIVTGGGRGIGKGIALEFAKEGANVIVSGTNVEKLESTVDEIKKLNGNAVSLEADVSSEKDINNLIQETIAEFKTIDILVNNAGIAYPVEVVDTTNDQWDRTMAVNLTGLFKCIRAVLPYMIKNKYGRIVNISSILGKEGRDNLGAYCASKFGIIGLSEALAREVMKYSITVNVICPDRVVTDMARNLVTGEDFNKWLQPEHVGRAAVFLCSDKDSDRITGTTVDVLANFGLPLK